MYKVLLLMKFINNIVVIVLLFTIFSGKATGKNGNERFRWGVEWGLQAPFMNNLNCAYITEDGYLVEINRFKTRRKTNGFINGFIGYDVAKRINLSLYSGYMGLAPNERGIPISLRISAHVSRFKCESGSSVFAEGGIFMQKDVPLSEVFRTGYSYRMRLAPFLSVDLEAGMQASSSHPKVFDSYSGKYIDNSNLSRIKNLNAGVFFAVALVF